MKRPTLHTNKSTESTSYEIVYSILDCIDTINELNSRLDKTSPDHSKDIDEIFYCLNIMTIEIRALVKYWTDYRQKFEKENP